MFHILSSVEPSMQAHGICVCMYHLLRGLVIRIQPCLLLCFSYDAHTHAWAVTESHREFWQVTQGSLQGAWLLYLSSFSFVNKGDCHQSFCNSLYFFIANQHGHLWQLVAPNQDHKDILVVVAANLFITIEMERSFGVDLLSLGLQAYYQQKGRRPSLMERQT